MAHYKALKHSIRGKAGSLVEVHGNDVKLLQRNGVIGDKPYQGKAEDAEDIAHTPKAEVKQPKSKQVK